MGTNGSVNPEGLREAMAATLDPLRGHLATVEAAIAEKEAELAELKELRRLVSRTLNAADPDAPKSGPKGARKKWKDPVSAETLATVREALAELEREHPDGFKAKDVSELTGLHTTSTAKALSQLADRGEIRLDRQQAGPRGGKFYKVNPSVAV